REIGKNKDLSQQQKDSMLENIMYPLSLTIPLSSIKKMQYYVSDLKNGKAKSRIALGAFIGADIVMEGILLSQSNDYSQPNNETVAKSGKFTADDALLLGAAGVMEYYVYYVNRHIHPYKWQIVAKK